MDFTELKLKKSKMSSKYSFDVSMYTEPPTEVDNITNQLDAASERLKLYKILYYKKPATPEKLKDLLEDSPFRPLLEKFHSSGKDQARKLDVQSHWLLRVAYSNKPDFFIKCERKWFMLRFINMKNIAKNKFMEQNNLNLTPITDARKMKLGITDPQDYYRIILSDIPEMLSSRQHLLIKGKFYFPYEDFVYYILDEFEKKLRTSMFHISKLLPNNDSQLKFMVDCLELVDPTAGEFTSPDKLSLKEIDEAAKANFPLCMQWQHETLRKTHHLKYFSRMQYGLFLKGTGLTLTESLKFWEDEFVHDMSEDRFNRKYSYLFKHQYGTVGSKIDQRPYSCEKIFNEGAGHRACHGCPFKNWDEYTLKNKLEENKIPNAEIPKIISFKKEKRYSEACTKYFEAHHGVSLEKPIVHPNQFFQASRNVSDADGLVDIEDLLDRVFEDDSE